MAVERRLLRETCGVVSSEFVMFVGALISVILRSYAVEIEYVRGQASC